LFRGEVGSTDKCRQNVLLISGAETCYNRQFLSPVMTWKVLKILLYLENYLKITVYDKTRKLHGRRG